MLELTLTLLPEDATGFYEACLDCSMARAASRAGYENSFAWRDAIALESGDNYAIEQVKVFKDDQQVDRDSRRSPFTGYEKWANEDHDKLADGTYDKAVITFKQKN